MPYDHSLTYRLNDFRNFGHVARLKEILRIIDSKVPKKVTSYADFGCSNGFITAKIAEKLNIESARGFDWSDNIDIATERHPEHRFERFNLNQLAPSLPRFDLVTCFETIEHTGNPKNAVANLLASVSIDGTLLISVPIEIGPMGFAKYIVKRGAYRYDLPLNCGDGRYAKALVFGERVSQFRSPADGYGSHFGFDYRDVDDYLQDALTENGTSFSMESWNSLATRFYLVRLGTSDQ